MTTIGRRGIRDLFRGWMSLFTLFIFYQLVEFAKFFYLAGKQDSASKNGALSLLVSNSVFAGFIVFISILLFLFFLRRKAAKVSYVLISCSFPSFFLFSLPVLKSEIHYVLLVFAIPFAYYAVIGSVLWIVYCWKSDYPNKVFEK